MKLPTLSDRVIELRKDKTKDNIRRFWFTEGFNNFIRQPLKLGQFIPCKDGKPLDEPDRESSEFTDERHYENGAIETWFNLERYEEVLLEYQKAESEVLFKGFEHINTNKYNSLIRCGDFHITVPSPYNQSIADLCEKVELTQTGIKKAGL